MSADISELIAKRSFISSKRRDLWKQQANFSTIYFAACLERRLTKFEGTFTGNLVHSVLPEEMLRVQAVCFNQQAIFLAFV